MSENSHGETCQWPVEYSVCGKPVVGQVEAVRVNASPPLTHPLDVCQEHLDEVERSGDEGVSII